VFAGRGFARGDCVFVERPLLRESAGDMSTEDLKDSEREALMRLVPCDADSDLTLKVARNAFDCGATTGSTGSGGGGGGGGGKAMFIAMARVNHSCVGNCDHQYVPELNVLMLVAIRPIAANEEITYSYLPRVVTAERRAALAAQWAFTCHCADGCGGGARGAAALRTLDALCAADVALARALRMGQWKRAAADSEQLLAKMGVTMPAAAAAAGAAGAGAAPDAAATFAHLVSGVSFIDVARTAYAAHSAWAALRKRAEARRALLLVATAYAAFFGARVRTKLTVDVALELTKWPV